MADRQEIISIDGREAKITRPEKVLFPKDSVTKRDLIDYYRHIAPFILPHLRGRPIAMERYPDGIDKSGFFHKAVPSYYPSWIRTAVIEKKTGGTVRHVVCEDPATLAYLANQACITPTSGSAGLASSIVPIRWYSTWMGGGFEPVRSTAQSLKELLDRLEIPVYLKTTGSRGLHVVVPLRRTDDFESVRAFAKELARIVVSEDQGQRTLEEREEKRGGRVFVDTNRNAYAQTIAPPYAVRARGGAPVSIPLYWRELGKKELRSDGVTIRTVFARLDEVGNPWADFWQHGASLNGVRKRMEKLDVPQ